MCWEVSGFLPLLLGDPKIPTRIFLDGTVDFLVKENLYILISSKSWENGIFSKGTLIDTKIYTTRFDEILHSCLDRFPLIL